MIFLISDVLGPIAIIGVVEAMYSNNFPGIIYDAVSNLILLTVVFEKLFEL